MHEAYYTLLLLGDKAFYSKVAHRKIPLYVVLYISESVALSQPHQRVRVRVP